MLKEASPKWYPVYTRSRAEKQAFELLQKKGVESYLPLQKTLKQWSDRKKWVTEPLFQSYLFVRITQQQQTEVLMTKGIVRFLYHAGRIAAMPDQQINEIQLLLSNEIDLEVTAEHIAPGEKVVIKAGPLKGLSGEMVSYKSQKQLVVRLENLGQSILVNASSALVDRL
ncbi:UpxY family transcription antiterminator [Mucilaginibacter sp. HMF7410]|uniref:UpxY family transcription antiterminator n=2 Tax=Mucilaginibacter arboris TaxID=2682090 RepID=A0A7K1STJ5_9SPHI|nr:UpxY family transcription antiterminator [Mucilaginibacter arboris]